MLKDLHKVTYNQMINCANSVDKFDGNSGTHVLTIFKIAIASIL